MKLDFLYSMACTVYAAFLRELIKKAIDDPNEEWDDSVLILLDKIFNYRSIS